MAPRACSLAQAIGDYVQPVVFVHGRIGDGQLEAVTGKSWRREEQMEQWSNGAMEQWSNGRLPWGRFKVLAGPCALTTAQGVQYRQEALWVARPPCRIALVAP